jgi:ATP-dependent Clp protease adaptor protein ClpS
MKPFGTIDIKFINTIFNHKMGESESEVGVVTDVREKIEKPKFYKVMLHNDDYTTMEFVLYVLKRFFGKTPNDAERIMLKVHNEGIGICGIYTFEIAETKVDQVKKAANQNGHPLQCTMEKE